jgi:putative FmdB family regulatory protein
MPIYEYKCENGHVFDAIQKFADEPLAECEVCGAPAKRVLTPPAIHFKGSGFHNTDYKKRSSGNGGGKSEGSAGDSSDSKSSDSKSGDSASGSGSSSSDKTATSAAD